MHASRIAFVVAASLAVSTPAMAADLGGQPVRSSIKDAPAAYAEPHVFSWTGFYVGAHLGYGWSETDWQSVSDSLDGSGWLAGGQIGYNWQRGAIVFGAEADASSSWVQGSGGAGCCGYDANWLASVRGRLGIAINGNRTLLYGTGGVAWADLDYRGVAGSFSETHSGWVYGGGIEHALSPNLSVRLEYLHYDFDPVTAPAGSLDAGPTRLDPSTDAVRFGLNVKF